MRKSTSFCITHTIFVAVAIMVMASQVVCAQQADIEKALVEFHNKFLPGVDNYQTPIEYPKSDDYYFKWASLVIAVGEDIALIVTVGHSEAVVKGVEKGITAVDVGTDIVKGIDGRAVEAVIDFAVGEAVDLGLKKAVGKKIPGFRTGVGVYGVLKAALEEEEKVFRSIVAQREIQQFVNEDAPAIATIQKQIDDVESPEKRNEYQQILSAMLQKKAELTVYRQMQFDIHKNAIGGIEYDILKQVNPAMATAMADGKITPNWQLSNAVYEYAAGRMDNLQLVSQIRDYMLSNAQEPTSYTESMMDQRLLSLGDKLGGIDKAKTKINKYGGSPLQTTQIIDSYQSLDKAIPQAYRMIATLDMRALSQKIPADFKRTEPNQGTIVPTHVGEKNTFLLLRNARHWQPKSDYGALKTREKNPVQTIIAVVDSSGSMKQTDPKGLRRMALEMMIDTSSPGIALGIIGFNDQAMQISQPVMLESLGNTGRTDLRNKIAAIGSSGQTDIRAGLQMALQAVPTDGSTTTFVLLTDGQDKKWKGEADFILPGIAVHTIALSDQADREGLSRLSAATGGIPEIARDAADLQRIFSNLFGTASGLEVLLVKSGMIQQGEQVVFPVPVEPGQEMCTFQVGWPGSDIDLTLESPDGRRMDIDTAVRNGSGTEAGTYDIIRIQKPIPGIWQAHLNGVQIAAGGEPYSFRATANDCAVTTRWKVNVPVPEIGQPFTVDLESGDTVTWRQAHIQIQQPDGQTETRTTALGGLSAALGASSGTNVVKMIPQQTGVYRLQVVVEGELADGAGVQRSFDRTLRVAAVGKGEKYKRGIDLFIRRSNVPLR